MLPDVHELDPFREIYLSHVKILLLLTSIIHGDKQFFSNVSRSVQRESNDRNHRRGSHTYRTRFHCRGL